MKARKSASSRQAWCPASFVRRVQPSRRRKFSGASLEASTDSGRSSVVSRLSGFAMALFPSRRDAFGIERLALLAHLLQFGLDLGDQTIDFGLLLGRQLLRSGR